MLLNFFCLGNSSLFACNFIPAKRLRKSANESNCYALLVHSNWNYFISAVPQLVRSLRCSEAKRISPPVCFDLLDYSKWPKSLSRFKVSSLQIGRKHTFFFTIIELTFYRYYANSFRFSTRKQTANKKKTKTKE